MKAKSENIGILLKQYQDNQTDENIELFIRNVEPVIYSAIRNIIPFEVHHIIDEIKHTVMHKVINIITELKHDEGVYTYIKTMAGNEAKHYLRTKEYNRKGKDMIFTVLHDNSPISKGQEKLLNIIWNKVPEILERYVTDSLFHKSKTKERAKYIIIFKDYHYHGIPYTVSCKKYNVNYGTLKTGMYRIKAYLKKELIKELDPETLSAHPDY